MLTKYLFLFRIIQKKTSTIIRHKYTVEPDTNDTDIDKNDMIRTVMKHRRYG